MNKRLVQPEVKQYLLWWRCLGLIDTENNQKLIIYT